VTENLPAKKSVTVACTILRSNSCLLRFRATHGSKCPKAPLERRRRQWGGGRAKGTPAPRMKAGRVDTAVRASNSALGERAWSANRRVSVRLVDVHGHMSERRALARGECAAAGHARPGRRASVGCAGPLGGARGRASERGLLVSARAQERCWRTISNNRRFFLF
jgi:hypothetical protein